MGRCSAYTAFLFRLSFYIKAPLLGSGESVVLSFNTETRLEIRKPNDIYWATYVYRDGHWVYKTSNEGFIREHPGFAAVLTEAEMTMLMLRYSA